MARVNASQARTSVGLASPTRLRKTRHVTAASAANIDRFVISLGSDWRLTMNSTIAPPRTRPIIRSPGAAVARPSTYALSVTVTECASHRDAFYRIRSEEHTSELQSLLRLPYAALCF